MCIQGSGATSHVAGHELRELPSLSHSVPNPFHGETEIRLSLDQACHVELAVFDVRGRRVTTLLEGTQATGARTVRWDATDSHGFSLPSGVYFYRLTAGDLVETKKLILER